MPLASDVLLSVVKAATISLWDGPPIAQAIVNVQAIALVTAVRIRFTTLYPAWATVEVYRMVHGEIDLDMEKENIVRTEVELFGDARSQHNVLIRGLEQERRFWFRISVARRSPGEPAATGRIRARGEFATLRRFVLVDIENIHIDDDSDDNTPGEIRFSSAMYDATVVGGPRLTPRRFRHEESLPDGRTVEAPFGTQESIAKAPDALGIWVLGYEDDTPVIPYPGHGLNIIALGAPERMPDGIEANSTNDYDFSEALGFVGTRQLAGRSTQPFGFSSLAGARLAFTVNGRAFETVEQTLAPRDVPPWKLLVRTTTTMTRDARAATRLWTPDGRVEVAIGGDGELLRRDARRAAAWEVIDAPAIVGMQMRILKDGGCLLLGTGRDGALHAARVSNLRREQPRWQALEPLTGDHATSVEGPDGTVWVLAVVSDGNVWLVGMAGAHAGRPSSIADGAIGMPALGLDRSGNLLVACATRSGMVVTVADAGGDVLRRETIAGAPLRPLGVTQHEREGVLLAALDGDRHVLVRRVDERDGRWEHAGPLDDLLDGPFERVALDAGEPSPSPSGYAAIVPPAAR